MDDLQLLRETRNDVGSVPPAVLASGRDRLMKLAEAEAASAGESPAPARPVRRPWRRVLISTGAAAAIAASFVVSDVAGSPERPGATAEAAEVLNNAAGTTIATSDPVVGPGQYLLVDTKAVYSSATSTTSDGSATYAWLASQDQQLYVPADRSQEWILNQEPSIPVQFFDEPSRRFAEKQQAELEDPARGPVATVPYGPLMRAPGGNFYDDEQRVLGGMSLKEALDTAPRDPQALLDLIYQRTAGAGPTPEEEAFVTIADTLRSGVIPADLRAALYQAAALVPGVTVVDREATLDGRTGISLGIKAHHYPARQEIIIDPKTGLLIGERVILLEDSQGLPAGTASAWTAITTSVVDEAP